jgi:eukaryotic-like serine/threonine-protein kinase
MSLAPGTRLGPYELVAPLGAGGMGEVYRAKDTRLGREVAVKVLPRHLSSNPEIRARFEREAKTVSSLNHPHICTLHDVGREGEIDYLVMELIEGETLAARLTKGALPLAEVLKFGAQIADALDRAHRAGVMHRDLKPGNVMLTKSGAKLMDFGLARATGLAAASELTSSPTMAGPLTAEGTILGTFQYMAPEQMEGQEADARADLWALGCVLYEMATGRRAFDGKSQASLIAAVMHTQPSPVSQVSSMSPPALDSLVAACLAKDPADRIQSAHDVKLQLSWIAEGGSKVGVAAPVATRRKGRERMAWITAAVAVVGAALSVVLFRAPSADTEPIFASIPPPAGKELPPYWSASGLSPDGRTVAYLVSGPAEDELWVRPLGSEAARPLPDIRGGRPLFWSYDGRFVAYFDEGKLKKVALDGGSPDTICNAKIGRGGSWSRDGVIVFAPTPEGPLSRVSSAGGESTPVTVLDPARHETSHRFPCFLPDGDHFLYVTLPKGPNGWDTFVGSLKSKSVKKIVTAGSAVTFAEPGFLVFARDGKIMAQRFDTGRLELEGDAVAIGDAPDYSDMDAEPVASASRNGRLTVLQSDASPTQLHWRDRAGTVGGPIALPPGSWKVLRLSPDGHRAGVANGTDIWIVDLARGMPTRFAPTMSTETSLAWSPDGSLLAFVSNETGRSEIVVGNADGAGSPERIPTTDAQFKYIDDWSPDGKFLVFQVVDPSTKGDLWLLPMSGDRKPVPYLATTYAENNARVSPDGRWMAYASDESGDSEVYVQSFPTPGHKVRVSSGGGFFPHWSSGGKELLYADREGAFLSVPVAAGEAFRPGAETPIFKRIELATGGDVTADGQRFLVSQAARAPHREIRLFVNWAATLEKR